MSAVAGRSHRARPSVVLRLGARLWKHHVYRRRLREPYAGDATRWDYERDESVEGRGTNRRDIFSIKLTAQVSPRNRVTFSHEYQHRCSGGTITSAGGAAAGAATTGSASAPSRPRQRRGRVPRFPVHVTQATWTSPLSNRVLLEAGFSRFQYLWAGFGIAPPDSLTSMIPVTGIAGDRRSSRELHVSRHVRPARFRMGEQRCKPNNWRASAYVTGAHNVKFGYQGSYQRSLQARDANSTLLRYTMNNRQLNGVSYTLATRWSRTTDGDVRALRSGSVDDGARHASGRAALRPGVELGAGRGQWHDRDLAIQSRADHLRAR